MAKKKVPARKNMLLRLDSETFDALTRFSAATGVAKMKLVNDFLGSAVPQLEELTKAAIEAKRGVPEATILRALHTVLTDSTRVADQLSLEIDAKLQPAKVTRARKRAA